ncbi:MAG TPA: ADP-glyceromanno-heptose 6-epimerase [Chitinophagaceae bacterium]|nr:ADP-glyceromanno-heptose 6-epimerase [Chitinophagaceae bacterium]
MDKSATIVVTGAAGFIGSCLVEFLNEKGFNNLLLVDDFSREDKKPNLSDKKYLNKIEREEFFEWQYKHKPKVDFIFHIGARTDTTEFNYAVHQHLNVEYSEKLWDYCTIQNIPLVYASSAATYGAGEFGYNDEHDICQKLKPLNPYGISKNEFDKWVLHQGVHNHPPFWAGLKFFNVYGPNEYHKGRMASVIFHSFKQVKDSGVVRLFKSHRPDFKDGQQLRDFIYVKDVVKVCFWLMEQQPRSAIYNLGTGTARTFHDLAKATYAGMDLDPSIQYIDMPEDIRDKYQYFTEANMKKLRDAGYKDEFYSLEKGVEDYVRNYLTKDTYY